MTNLTIKEHSIFYMDIIHFLKTHHLRRQLHFIDLIPFGLTVLVFNNYRIPSAWIFGMADRIF